MPKKLSALVRRAVSVHIVKKSIDFLRRQPAINYAVVGSIVVLVAYSGMFLVAALTNALSFNGFAADGAFQALNPLRRLAAGQAIGADFNTFHGVGMPLLHLPLYYIFGQGLFGSEMARGLLSPITFMLATFVFVAVVTKSKKAAIIATAVVMVIASTVTSMLGMFVLPFTSMLGVRSLMAVVLAIVMVQQVRLVRPLSKKVGWLGWTTWYEVLVAATLVTGFLCGTEFGVAAILGFFVAHIAYKTNAASTWRVRLLSAARIAGIAVVLLFAALAIITRGHPLQPLQYAFSAIPMDQFWYFGVPPNTFLHLGNIVPLLATDGSLLTLLFFVALAVVVTIAVHRLQLNRVATQTFICMLLAGAFATVSMLGYYYHSQAYSLTRLSFLIIAAGGVLLWRRYAAKAKVDVTIALPRKKLRVRTSHVAVVVALVFVGWCAQQTVQVIQTTIVTYDIKKVLRKTKAYVLGVDTNPLETLWNRDDSIIMPLVQADNYITVADVTNDEFAKGLSKTTHEFIVDPGQHSSFMRKGQIIYLNASGRQIVSQVTRYNDTLLRIKVENTSLKLEQGDAAPSKVIVAEDFKHDSTKLWSTYTALFELEMGTLNPSRQGADYIIHALGPELRQQYIDDFVRVEPKFVTTLNKKYFAYEEWLQNASWDFYSLLDANYEVIGEGTIHTLWQRRDQPWQQPLAKNEGWQKLDVTQNGTRIQVPRVNFADLPDINTYINEQRTQQAERDRQNGKDVQPRLLLPLKEFTEIQARQNAEITMRDWAKREGQGHNTTPWEEPAAEPAPTAEPGAELQQPRRAVVLVKLRYETKNPLGWVPLIGKTVRNFVQPNNLYNRTQVSLPPYKNELVFPIIVSELNKDSFLSIKNYALLPTTPETKILSAEWQLLKTSPANLKTLTGAPGPTQKLP